MTKEIRVRSKRLCKGNFLVFCLYLAVCIMMISGVNLLPLVYEELISYSARYMQWKYADRLDFFVSVIIVLFSVFVFYCLSSSVTRCFMKRASGESILIDDIFYYFISRRAFENFGLRISLSFIKLAALLFFQLPFAVCVKVLHYLLFSSVSLQISVIVTAAALVFFTVGIVFYRLFSCLLFLCPFLICSQGQKSVKSILQTSVNIMKDNIWELMRIKLSFTGYFLLCVLIFPVGYVWVYYRQTMTLAAQKFIKECV